MISPKNRVAVVTGAGRGIGRAIAQELGALGMRVALAARTQSELDETAATVARSIVVPADVCDVGELERLFARVSHELGAIDVLVNAAGIYYHGQVVDATEEDFDRVIDTNLRGVFSTCRFVLPQMIEQARGHIVNIASIAGKVGTAQRALYCASKFGVVGFSQALAEEVREHGVRVSVLCPGSTNTDFSPKDSWGKSRERMLQPQDIAHAVRMIIGQEANSFISEVVMRPTRKP